MTIRFYIVILFISLLLACDTDEVDTTRQSSPAPSQQVSLQRTERVTDQKVLEQGRALYSKNCSQCHGDKAQGTIEWKIPGLDGKYLPPPLNGTAHAWHHPTDVLLEIIKDGTMPEGNMPSWEGKLTDNEIKVIISWLQSLWPDEVFKTWQEMDLSSRED